MTSTRTTTEALDAVTACFRLASTGSDAAVIEAVIGLRSLMLAGLASHDVRASEDMIATLAGAITAAAPVVAEAVGTRIETERVHLGMAAAGGFASLFTRTPAEIRETVDLPLAADRLDHIALLADELDAVIRRRNIEARGNPVRRAYAIRRAVEAEPAGATLQ